MDRSLQRARINMAIRYLHVGDRILDVGTNEGELFDIFGRHAHDSVGIDPLAEPNQLATHSLQKGYFPEAAQGLGTFDAVVMLAVLEHAPAEDLTAWATAIVDLLRSGGRFIATVPSPVVDPMIDTLRRFRILDGMETEQHYGFDPETTVDLMTQAGLVPLAHKRFQLRCNNLFVFQRPSRLSRRAPDSSSSDRVP